MSRIIKKYWHWDEKYYPTENWIGTDISELLKNELVFEVEQGVFEGINAVPFRVDLAGEKVNSITFSKTIPFLENNEIWDLEMELLVSELDKLFEPASSDDNGLLLRVVFRDYFVAIVTILNK